MYEFLEAGHIGYAIRLPANSVLQRRIGYLRSARSAARRTRCAATTAASPIGRRAGTRRAASWPRSSGTGELYPRVGFIVTNLARPAERVVAFYNQRGTAE